MPTKNELLAKAHSLHERCARLSCLINPNLTLGKPPESLEVLERMNKTLRSIGEKVMSEDEIPYSALKKEGSNIQLTYDQNTDHIRSFELSLSISTERRKLDWSDEVELEVVEFNLLSIESSLNELSDKYRANAAFNDSGYEIDQSESELDSKDAFTR